MKISLLFTALVAVSAIVACSKKGDDPQPLTPTQLLTAQKWRVSSATIAGPGQPTIDLTALSAPCKLDDYVQFADPSTYVVDEGATKCDSRDAQTQLGTWAFANNDTQLSISYTGDNYTATVNELTASSLKLTTVRLQSDGTKATIVQIFTAIK
ncbi:lipocalin family protein [Hymenobacter coccineus]|uniref:Lipocalin-like domain-containing protein n=1 Tax=Hymenobacter coccineus TaxID=1908235 RepID=A0A1G1TKT6_9BACT|nr:lipocalin family protein [Hymenobacter coccineus]OGX91494.1 hypothetical protein BEN49_04795 [Hymenobacter coccineus]